MPAWPTSQQQQSVGFGYKVPAQSATVSSAASGPAPSSSMPAPLVISSLKMAAPVITSMAQPATIVSSPSSSQAAPMSPVAPSHAQQADASKTPIVSATSVTRMVAPLLVKQPAPSTANTAAPQPATSSVVDKLADAMAAMTGGRGDTNVSVTAAGPAAQPKVSDVRAGVAAPQATPSSGGPDKILIGAIIVAALAAGYLIFKKKET